MPIDNQFDDDEDEIEDADYAARTGEDAYADEDWDAAAETVPCPYCNCEIDEDALRCPHCENYISQLDAPSRPRPWWIILGLLLCLVIFYIWITRG